MRIVLADVETGLPVDGIAQQCGRIGVVAGFVQCQLEGSELLQGGVLVVRIDQQQELPGHLFQRVVIVHPGLRMESVAEVVVGIVFVGGHQAAPAQACSIRWRRGP